ncbi:RagB/SusD family nutrient uptake outer membrane protein [Pseudopedobacter sp.]|uniref:RagB/SusD family nutrient uptake outer membrane protein n=1 Tax=Pseudopedobacter sp. TaxID=1936787 RepID=UPI00333E52B3
MKKIIDIFSLCGILLLFSSCQKWLDMPSESKFDTNTTFENASKAEMAVLGAYSAAISQEMYYQLLSGTDECMSTENNNSKEIFARYAYDATNTVNSTYTAMYSAAERANSCIKGITALASKSGSDKILTDKLLGEAYAIRAYAYFNIVRFWGDVPFSTIPTMDATTFTLPRTNRDIIYDQCVADLQKATELIPWKKEAGIPSERISKQAAYGLLARVALHAAGYSLRWNLDTYDAGSVKLATRPDAARVTELYTIARNACNAVMIQNENSLVSDFDKLWRDLLTKRYNDESIWEFGMYGPNHPDVRLAYTSGISTPTGSTYSKSGPQIAAMPTLYFEYEEGDQRRDASICNYEILNAAGTASMNAYPSRTIGKYRATWKKDRGSSDSRRDVNAPILRYADILLMFAEAESKLNGVTDDAKEAYEKVRLRAFKNDAAKIGTTPTDPQEFLNAIIKERKLELAFEGVRRTDLVRWGVQYETLMDEKSKLIDMANHTGKYANIPKFAAYKRINMTVFEEPTIGLPIYKTYLTEPDQTEKNLLTANGYTLVNLYGTNTGAMFYNNELKADAIWVTRFFNGLTKNKTELLPLSNTMMNENPELRAQQHPLYR